MRMQSIVWNGEGTVTMEFTYQQIALLNSMLADWSDCQTVRHSNVENDMINTFANMVDTIVKIQKEKENG